MAEVKAAGGRLIVSPNTNPAVIRASVAAGLISSPGYFTPSEAFAAIDAGAHALKFFPAEAATPAVIKAQRAVLPRHIPLVVVGGIRPDTMRPVARGRRRRLRAWLGPLHSGPIAARSPPRKARAYVAGLSR